MRSELLVHINVNQSVFNAWLVYLISIRTCCRISELSLNFISKLVINNTSDVSTSYILCVFLSYSDFSLVSSIYFLVIHLLIKLFYILFWFIHFARLPMMMMTMMMMVMKTTTMTMMTMHVIVLSHIYF